MQTWIKINDKKALVSAKCVDNGCRGRGNNWAHGYGESSHLPEIMDMYRKCIEENTCHDGSMLIHSLGGGTGSGLGSRIAESLSDDYPKQYLMSCGIIPFESGETALQHYNALLSMRWMSAYSDCVSLFSNDTAIQCINRQYSAYTNHLSINDLNDYISYSLADVILPTYSSEQKGIHSLHIATKPSRFNGWQFVTNLTPIPSCRFISIHNSHPVSSLQKSGSAHSSQFDSWEDTENNLSRNITSSHRSLDYKPTVILSELIVRGAAGTEFWTRKNSLEKKIKIKMGHFYTDLSFKTRVSATYAIDVKDVSKKSMTVVSNDTSIMATITKTVEKSKKMYDCGAYLHWYQKYIDQDVKCIMRECSESLLNTVDVYSDFMKT